MHLCTETVFLKLYLLAAAAGCDQMLSRAIKTEINMKEPFVAILRERDRRFLSLLSRMERSDAGSTLYRANFGYA